MDFDTQRLRVQIPCGSGGSLVKTAVFCGGDKGGSVLTAEYCGGDKHGSVIGPETEQHCLPGTRVHELPTDCGTTYLTDLLITKDLTERFVLEAEDLPRLREQLELRLKMLSAVADATAAARRQIKANLRDIEASEETLRNMGNG